VYFPTCCNIRDDLVGEWKKCDHADIKHIREFTKKGASTRKTIRVLGSRSASWG